MAGTKIINLFRGALDGLQVHTTESLSPESIFWVPSPHLQDDLSGMSFSEIRDMLDDKDNERYLPYQSHLIAYTFMREMEPEQNLPTFLYEERPDLTYARIDAREHYDQEQ